MSLELMERVWKLKELNSTEKYVLLAYVSYADEIGRAWPSKETIARCTSLSKTTIKRTVNRLCTKGHLVEMPLQAGYGADSKLRKVRAYLIQPEGLNPTKNLGQHGPLSTDTEESVCQVHNVPGILSAPTGVNQQADPLKRRSSRFTEPPNNIIKNKSFNNHRGIILDNLPDSIDPEIAREIIDYREKQKKPLTQGAFNRLIKTAMKAPEVVGITANAALQKIPDRGWQGLELEWLKPTQSKASPHVKKSNRRSRDISISEMLNDQW